nr:disco-interacting protein 2 homolog C-like [Oncorhynchus nerka]
MAEREASPLPLEVRARLAELELELSEGDITQKGYEKKRSKLIRAYFPHPGGMEGMSHRPPFAPPSAVRFHRRRSSGTRDERYRSDVHSEAVQAVLARHVESNVAVPMPSKRRSLVVQTSMDAYTPPGLSPLCSDSSSGSEEEAGPGNDMPGMEHWMTRPAHLGPAHLGSTSSSSSSTQSGGSGNAGRLADSLAHTHLSHPHLAHAHLTHTHLTQSHHVSAHHSQTHHGIGHLSLKRKAALGMAENGGSLRRSCEFGSDMLWPPPLESDENHSAPPDVTGYSSDSSHSRPHSERHIGTIARNTQKYGNAERMETGDGVPVSSRVSAKIQQLVNTLKMPRRPPLREFFVDDFEELLEVQQPDPKQPRPEGAEMLAVSGEALGVVTNWPPSLEAALQRWGTISPKAPCLTSLDTTGKPLYVLTYGKLWSRSIKLAYNILHKLGSKQEPMLRPGDRVALVFPNNDPVAFMVAFYGCLLAEVVPVPIEVPLTRKDAGSQQIGFLLGSCGVTVALTSDACHKGLPKSATGEIPQFRGWPKLLWFVTESKHLSKPPRDWFPHIKDANSDTAYIEYKTCKDGSVLGVTVMRIALLTHCQSLTQSCGYTEAETIVNVLDFKKDVGLWHGILTSVMNMMHVISVPYSLMKVNPLSWIQKVYHFKAKVACVKSRDMHWALVAHREQKDISLSSLRMLLVADGSNPWSISSCDAFLNVFQSKGLRSEVICPCASSPEALTVAIRRPVEDSSQPPGRGVLSMQGLSYSVVRVDTEERLSVLTVQDVGTVMPGGRGLCLCVVRVDTEERLSVLTVQDVGTVMPGGRGLCLCVVRVDTEERLSVLTVQDVGTVMPGGRGLCLCVVRVDTEECLSVLTVQYVGTVMPGAVVCVVKPEGVPLLCKTDEIGELCVCSVATGTSYYGLTGMTKNTFEVFPVASGGGLVSEYAFVRTGLLGFVGPGGLVFISGKMDGLIMVSGRRHNADDIVATALAVEPMKFVYRGRIAVFSVTVLRDERIVVVAEQRPDSTEEDSFQWMSRVLQAIDSIHGVGVFCLGLVPANTLPKTPLGGIHLSETKQLYLEGGLHPCNVLMCPHTCVTNLPKPRQKQPETVSRSACVMTTAVICKLLRSKEAVATVDIRNWPPVLDTDDLPKKKLPALYKPCNPDALAYLDFSVSTTGMLAGVQMSHNAVGAFCRSVKLQCELYPSREVAICLDPYCGLGFVLWCLCSVYSGHQSILIPPVELESNPALWLLAVSQLRVRDTFCSYSVMELCTKGLGLQTEALKARGLDLSRVRACVVVAEERPRMSLTHSFSKLFKDLGLHPRSVSTAFGCRVNLAICLQGTSGPDPTTVYVDMRALRHDRVRLVERGSPHSLPLMESGKILPGVRIIIANPETKGPLGDSHLGEIWVHSAHNGSGYYSGYGEEVLQSDHFTSRLSFGDTSTVWARTGYLGFLRRTELTDASGERHDALYVVGALEEAMELRGMRYHPIDIETSVIRTHKNIMECAVFPWTNLLVVVIELEGSEQEALDLVPMVTKAVLEEHYLIVGVVVVTDIGVIPINSRGEKQRMHLRDGFLQDQLDPIYVAYNM